MTSTRQPALVATPVAVAYFAAAASGIEDPALRSSAAAFADGRVWLLLTSALEPQGAAPLLQVAAGAALAALLIARAGAPAWWRAALAGHVLSALAAYGMIGIAILLGSAGAERAASVPDHGVSCVMGGTAGALLGRGRGDGVALAAGGLAAVVLLATSSGWYGIEHPLSIAVGAAATWGGCRARGRARAGTGRGAIAA